MTTLSGTLEALPVVFTGGAGLGAGLFFLKWLFEWIGARVDRREDAVAVGAAQLQAATQALIENLQKQINDQTERIGLLVTRLDLVESELDECRAKHAEAQEQIARLKGILQGTGDARQHAHLIVASERMKDRETK